VKIVVYMENNQNGGVDTFCLSLLNNWPSKDDSFVLVCNASHPGCNRLRESIPSSARLEEIDIPLSWMISRRWLRWLPRFLQRAPQPFFRILLYPLQMRYLSHLFRKIEGDALLVLNGGFPGGETSRIANIAWAKVSDAEAVQRNVHNFHNFAVLPRTGFGWFENWIDRRLRQSVGQFVGVSKVCADSLKVRSTFSTCSRVSYIYNGIDLHKSGDKSRSQMDLRQQLDIGMAPLCLILANYEPRKGYRFLFEAFAEVAKSFPNAHLVACGGGTKEECDEVDLLRTKIAPECNVHLLGFVPDGANLISQADVVVISSQSHESFGLSATEAMTRGVPVVSTRCGGLPEVLGDDGDVGYLVEISDYSGFSDRIISLLLDPELRTQVGNRGRQRAAALFTAQRMAGDYHAALVVGSNPELLSDVSRFRSEWFYIIRKCISPTMAWQFSKVICSVLHRRLITRFTYRRIHWYPEHVKAQAIAIKTFPSHQIVNTSDVLCKGPHRLKLATGYLCFDGWPNWDTDFDDQEQFLSLHRWNWLLRSLTDEPDPPSLQWGIELMRSWLAAMSVIPSGDAGESYTTGERVVNACLFSRHITGSWDGLPTDILASFKQMAGYLSKNIEYYSDDLSGNHVVNNARALLFAGHCCDKPELVGLGRALLADRLPVLVSEGFLREGSSHYQYLFTRWLLELRLLASEKNDTETLSLLNIYIPGLLDRCYFFRISIHGDDFAVPTFGDVSPDCEPVWLHHLLESPLSNIRGIKKVLAEDTCGWARLFSNYEALTVDVSLEETVTAVSWVSYKRAGWHRLNCHGWTAIWHVESSIGPAISSHAHQDVGSLVLYRHGREVLIDPGRFDYSGSVMGNYGAGGSAHNLVTLNGRSPMLSRGDNNIPEKYKEAACDICCEVNKGVATVTIEHTGFERIIGRNGVHSRSFVFLQQEVQIADSIEGQGSCWLEWRFHQPLNSEQPIALELMESSDVLRASSLVGSQSPIGGWHFPAYGVKQQALTQCYSALVKLPVSCRFRLIEKKGEL